MTTDFTYESTLREVTTDAGVLRYHDAGPTDGPPLLLLHGSGPGVTGWRNFRGVLGTFAEFSTAWFWSSPASVSVMTSVATQ